MGNGNREYGISLENQLWGVVQLLFLFVLVCVAILQTIAVLLTTVNSFSFRALLQHHLSRHTAR